MNVFKYSHLNAKISAMKGKMLNQEDINALMLRSSVAEIASYLKNNTYYSNALSNVAENDVHRGMLEILLYRAEISDSLKVARYLKGKDKMIYRFVYRKYEIEDLKKMLRTLQMGKSLSEIDTSMLFISKYSKINFNEVLKATTIKELVEGIHGTNFYPILKPLMQDERHIDIFAAEMALDLYYYSKLKEQLDTIVGGRDKEIFASIFGTDGDIKNILGIYRAKKYYETNREMLYRYLIPMSYKLKKSDIEKMIEAETMEEFMTVFEGTYYAKYLGTDPDFWSINHLKLMLKIQHKNTMRNQFSLAPIVGYVVTKELEIHNIVAIIEGIRYKVEQEKIKEQLVGYEI